MKMKKRYILLFLIGLFFSCKEESLPEPNTGTPVFTIAGTLGGNSIDINAGDNDFYMFTEFEKDETNVFTFSGTFAKLEPDCNPNCNEQLRISIRDFQMTEDLLVTDIDNSLKVGDYEYDNGREDSIEMTVISSYSVSFINKTIISFPGEDIFTWRFSPPQSDPIEVQTFGLLSVPEPMNFPALDFPVTLERFGFEPIITCPGYTRTLDTQSMDCSTRIEAMLDTVSSGILVGLEENGNVANFEWINFDPDAFGAIQEPGDYCVAIEHLTGCLDTVCIRTQFNEEQSHYCSEAFDYVVEENFETIMISPDNPFRLSEVVIEYVNEDGISFRSDLFPQTDESRFEILEVSDFEDNENGEKTKQLKVRFNCVLYDNSDLSLNFENAEVVMAVAYPGE